MRVLVCLMVCIVFIGCATTAINSDPSGAKVYVDGDYVGETPVAVGLSDWYSQSKIRCEKDGYKSQEKIVIKQTTTTYGTQTGMAYGSATNQYGGTTTAYGSGVGTTTTVKSRWPTEVFFKLEPIEKED